MKSQPALLDPRDARPLTSREISKVLCGIIGGVATFTPEASVVAPHVLQTLRHGGTIKNAHGVAARSLNPGDDEVANWAAALGATVVSLRGWCEPHDVDTALAWCAQNIHLVIPAAREAVAS